ncbi:MAG TPA: thioredoxin family protein [Dehalococcoidia bacterium]|nr:thioredoxin family protein [Dehalococcoidia bacterium]
MARETSVVTPQKFSEGFSYPAYIDQIKVNKDRFNGFYNDYPLKPEDAAFFKELVERPNGPARMLVLGEDWCGDVVRGMPVLARIAEAGGMEMSIFPRDQHHDIMNEYLKNGQWMSIPVAVFYTKDHQYICHWIERPIVAEEEMGKMEEAIRGEKPEITDQEFSRERRTRTAARAGDWIAATVAELKELLASSIS